MNKKLVHGNGYDHKAVLRLCDAVTTNAGSQFHAVYVLSAYLQQAVDPELFKSITKVCEMSDNELKDFLNNDENIGNQNGI